MASSNAPTVLRAISAAITLLSPLFSLVLLVLAVSHPPAHAAQSDAHRKQYRIKALGAYLAIGSLALLCTVGGALGLRSALESDGGVDLGIRGRGEAVIEALVFLELGASILYLANEHLIQGLKVYWTIPLVIELVCAATVSIMYSPLSRGSVSPFLPPVLSLFFTTSVLLVLGLALRVHMAKQRANNAQISPMVQIRTPSFSGTRLSAQSSILPASSTESSGASGSSHHHEKVVSPKSSLSDLTAVNHCRTNRHVDANTLESGAASSGSADQGLGGRISSSRSKSLLVFLIASQGASFLAIILQIAAVKVGLSESLSSARSPASAHAYAILQVFRSAFLVLCITGIMSALLLHAYNAYLHPAPTGRQSVADHSILPPVLNLSRMNAITVSLSTTPTTSPTLTAIKKRLPGEPYVPSFDRATKKPCFKSRFTDIAVNAANNEVVFKGANVNFNAYEGDRDCARKGSANGPLSHHGYSTSHCSSFACPVAKYDPSHRSIEYDLKLGRGDDGEHGYAYIYTKGQVAHHLPSTQMDPLDVGQPGPFRHHKHLSVDSRGLPSQNLSPSSKHISLQPSNSDSTFTNQAVENSFSSTAPSSPLHAPIEIQTSRFANPYPTPRSTPTATAFADGLSSPELPESENIPPSASSRPGTAESKATKSRKAGSSESHSSSSCEKRDRDIERSSNCSSSTHTRYRPSTPTPTPTRVPTPGLSFTPFIGSHVRKRESSNSRSQPRPPSPPSGAAFVTSLKGRAKTLSSKHDSISETLAQSFEGIRKGLGGSNGRTKYPLRSSTSQGSLGLGLGISSGFKFPQLTRRASELDKGSRNASTSTLAVTAEGVEPVEGDHDFMDLRDPFACPNALQPGGALRIVSQAEINLMGGRESRAGFRDDDTFEVESVPGSCGKTRGTRMSAWGKLPMPPSRSSSASTSPLSMRQYHRSTSPTPSPTRSPTKSKRRSSEKKGKSKSKSSKAESSWSGGSAESGGNYSYGAELPKNVCSEDADFICEEALIAQQLLMKLDEKLWAAASS